MYSKLPTIKKQKKNEGFFFSALLPIYSNTNSKENNIHRTSGPNTLYIKKKRES